MEILSPVKNYQACKVAVQAGCDAIYCASNKFGARVNASIDIDELKKIVYYCNLYQVKVYITCNTIVFEDELVEFFKTIDQLYLMGIDGILFQDAGLAYIVKKHYPDLEIHASTQMNINNLDAIKLLEKNQFSRIVLPREMNFDRIKHIKEHTNMELEVFGHGALCVCYSGLCFDSTLLDQKSANRGRCSQYCRMEQEIINRRTKKVIRTGHPLNLKDLNTISVFEKYLQLGIDSFKIEGRLKGLDYVYVNTKNYVNLRNLNSLIINPQKVYNRLFTTGRINHQNGAELVNLERENNNGYYVGKVIDIKKNNNKKYKFYQYQIIIETNETINKLDNLRFIDEDQELGQIVDIVEKVSNGYIIYSNNMININAKVYVTQNQNLLIEAKNIAKEFKRRVSIDVYIDLDEQFFQIFDQVYSFSLTTIEGDATTKKQIIEKLTQTKNTMFDLNITLQYLNPKNILQKSLKQLKKQILLAIEQQLIKHRKSQLINYLSPNQFTRQQNNIFYIEVRNLDQYQYIRNNFDGFIVVNNIDVAKAIKPHANDLLLIPRVMYDDDFQPYDLLVNKFNGLIVSELGALYRYQNHKNIISNFTFNTTNTYGQNWLLDQGVKQTILSIELNNEKYKSLANDNSIISIYGRIPIMIMDYCPINHHKTDTCGACRRCHNGDYYLHDKLNREFPLLYEGNYRIGMYSSKPTNLFPYINELQTFGVHNFYITLSFEGEVEMEQILKAINNNETIKFSTNSGCYFKKVL